MSAERPRTLATFFGLLSLGVQLSVLYRLFRLLVDYEHELTHWVQADVLFARLSFLKPALWSPTMFRAYVTLFIGLGVSLAAFLWARAILLWRRGGATEQQP